MDTKPPASSPALEIIERTAEAALSAVPLVGGPLAVAFVSAVGYKLNKRREEWFIGLAEDVQRLSERQDDFDLETLTDNDLFVDAVVTTTRMIEHTHQAEKIEALRNAVLNSVARDAPDADTQAIFLNLLDSYTASHLRILALLDDPPAWFASHGIPEPQAGLAGSRTQTVEAGLPEMRGRSDFYNLLVSELSSAGFLSVDAVTGMASPSALMSRLSTAFGKRFLKFITAPAPSGDGSYGRD